MSSAHPLLRLLLAHPELLAEHVGAYAELATQDGRALLARWQRQWRWRLIGYAALIIGLLLAGQALMLWTLFRPPSGPALTLLLLPLLPLAVGVLALQAASALAAARRRGAGLCHLAAPAGRRHEPAALALAMNADPHAQAGQRLLLSRARIQAQLAVP